MGFALPFAGGSSVKSAYSPLRIFCTIFFGNAGMLGATTTVGVDEPATSALISLSPSATSFPVLAILSASLIFVNDFSIGAAGIAPSCTPAMVHKQSLLISAYLHCPPIIRNFLCQPSSARWLLPAIVCVCDCDLPEVPDEVPWETRSLA